MDRLVYADGHLHSNPIKGLGIANIGKKFIGIGGWFIVLVSLPPHHYGYDTSLDGHMKAIEILISECKNARELGLQTVCLAGVHPAAVEDEVSRNPKHSIKVLEKTLTIIDYIAKLVQKGIVEGFGEVGRPHYKSVPEAFIVNNMIMRYVIALARDLNAYVHLHLEQGGELTAIDIEKTIDEIGANRAKTILHHLDIITAEAAQAKELTFTIPGKRAILTEAFKRLKPYYMVESDFIDDPKRPGVSAYPWDIVENQVELLNKGLVNEEYLYKINIDTVVRIYGVKPP